MVISLPASESLELLENHLSEAPSEPAVLTNCDPGANSMTKLCRNDSRDNHKVTFGGLAPLRSVRAPAPLHCVGVPQGFCNPC